MPSPTMFARRFGACLLALGLAACAGGPDGDGAGLTPAADIAPLTTPVRLTAPGSSGPATDVTLDCLIDLDVTTHPQIGRSVAIDRAPMGVAYHPRPDGGVALAVSLNDQTATAMIQPDQGRVTVLTPADAVSARPRISPAVMPATHLAFLGGDGVYGRALDAGQRMAMTEPPLLIALLDRIFTAAPEASRRGPDAADSHRSVIGRVDVDGHAGVLVRGSYRQRTEGAPGLARPAALDSHDDLDSRAIADNVYDIATGLPLRQDLDITVEARRGTSRELMLRYVASLTCARPA
ncbi:hypothetical protein P7L78_27555 [Tistrella bauzanensis]|uniref:hypothetical protein n=1 Tax=Tistrella TaxID=171436 RepID=UPI0031F5FC6E